ncbi:MULTISPECIES: MtnX-like HAD-IB family phosphatase [unclassified Variovorax]|uniref:MtnX-like HAD-IB family phosphatase n=1 Tax=unclassified Variovorax TaxID=663243 RepID=UPI003F47F3A5
MSESFQIASRAAATCTTPSAGWTIQCDFDGTISVEDVTDSLLRRFGGRGWQALEKAWESGQIGSRECMSGQVSLLDMSAQEFDSHLDRMSIDPHFRAFVGAARLRGIRVQVVSDGMDRAIKQILRAHGLGDLPVIANQLVQVGERGWRLYTPHARASCERASGNCKCACLSEQRKLHGKVLFIGDGSSDFCVAGKADFVLAKDRLIGHCRGQRIPHVAFENFREALALMLEITQPKDCLA